MGVSAETVGWARMGRNDTQEVLVIFMGIKHVQYVRDWARLWGTRTNADETGCWASRSLQFTGETDSPHFYDTKQVELNAGGIWDLRGRRGLFNRIGSEKLSRGTRPWGEVSRV